MQPAIVPPAAASPLDRNSNFASVWYLFFQMLRETAAIGPSMVAYGTRAQRLLLNAADIPDASLWRDTDLGLSIPSSIPNVLYQFREGGWEYVAGEMYDVLANRPADLDDSDTGFRFLASDTLHTFRWDGTMWVDVTSGGGGGGAVSISPWTLAASSTLITYPAPTASGQQLVVVITQPAAGGDEITWDAMFVPYPPTNINFAGRSESVLNFTGISGAWQFTGMIL